VGKKEKGKRKKEKKKKATAQMRRACVFNAGLLARRQFASSRSYDQPTQSRFYVVFLGPRASAEMVPKFHVGNIKKFRPTLPWPWLLNFDFGLDHPVHGGYG
jgi:hypothetical protein